MGLFYGEERIPGRWRELLAMREEISALMVELLDTSNEEVLRPNIVFPE